MKKVCPGRGPVERDLVFDLGMHKALDTAFYLKKGFSVIGLEANPILVVDAKNNLSSEIKDGHLKVYGKALWTTSGETIKFYLNHEKDGRSSALQRMAKRGGHQVEEITVQTITLGELLDEFGVPYYIKCDIEGGDEIFTQQLLQDARRPSFVSVEAKTLDLFAHLRSAKYDRFQLINQACNHKTLPPEPPREGAYVQAHFNGHTSGLFGLELDPQKWVDFETVCDQWLSISRLKRANQRLAHGWYDLHATTKAVLHDGFT